MYSFYKNIMMVFTLFFYNFFNGASGTTLYETWLSSMWSVLWTFLPILCVGVFDKDVDEQAVLAYPMLYAVGQVGSENGPISCGKR
jgi:magnesium-transporting ATPase (P-type)